VGSGFGRGSGSWLMISRLSVQTLCDLHLRLDEMPDKVQQTEALSSPAAKVKAARPAQRAHRRLR